MASVIENGRKIWNEEQFQFWYSPVWALSQCYGLDGILGSLIPKPVAIYCSSPPRGYLQSVC